MSGLKEIRVPDIGDFDTVDVVEVLVAVGDSVAEEDSLITLESDKASMEVPSPAAGVVREIKVQPGDQVGQDAVIVLLEAEDLADRRTRAHEGQEPVQDHQAPLQKPDAATVDSSDNAASSGPSNAGSQAAAAPSHQGSNPSSAVDEEAFANAYAGPGVRKLARELGADLGRVKGTGRKGRITPDDLKTWVKSALAGGGSGVSGGGVDGFEWPAMPEIDFGKFGDIEEKPLSRIRQVSARNLHRSWLHVPHVTQHDEADITEMEAFRKKHSEQAKKEGYKLTPLAFLLKAAAATLKALPDFNASLSPDGQSLIVKKYVHIGVAVDTPNGLVVPVIRDVDQKGLKQLAQEVVEAGAKARAGKLLPKDFQGACFTISSLGGIGGTAFTPIVNAPEVAILGVSRSRMTPVWQDGNFVPRLMLPLSLSYDHRVIDGASAARFTVHLGRLLADIRTLLL